MTARRPAFGWVPERPTWPLSDEDALELVRDLAGRLEMEPPRLVVSEQLFEDEGTPAAAERGGHVVHVDRWLLAEHGQRPLGVWAAVAHEVAHTYWTQHPDVCSGFPERFEDEDGAEYVAGQLAAALGQPHEINREYLELLLLIGATEGREHRDPMDRFRVFQQGYLNYLEGRPPLAIPFDGERA